MLKCFINTLTIDVETAVQILYTEASYDYIAMRLIIKTYSCVRGPAARICSNSIELYSMRAVMHAATALQRQALHGVLAAELALQCRCNQQ